MEDMFYPQNNGDISSQTESVSTLSKEAESVAMELSEAVSVFKL